VKPGTEGCCRTPIGEGACGSCHSLSASQSSFPHRRYLANPSLKLLLFSPLRLLSLRSLPRARYLAPPSDPRQSLPLSPSAAAHRRGRGRGARTRPATRVRADLRQACGGALPDLQRSCARPLMLSAFAPVWFFDSGSVTFGSS